MAVVCTVIELLEQGEIREQKFSQPKIGFSPVPPLHLGTGCVSPARWIRTIGVDGVFLVVYFGFIASPMSDSRHRRPMVATNVQ